jgi:hypothetical protein
MPRHHMTQRRELYTIVWIGAISKLGSLLFTRFHQRCLSFSISNFYCRYFLIPIIPLLILLPSLSLSVTLPPHSFPAPTPNPSSVSSSFFAPCPHLLTLTSLLFLPPPSPNSFHPCPHLLPLYLLYLLHLIPFLPSFAPPPPFPLLAFKSFPSFFPPKLPAYCYYMNRSHTSFPLNEWSAVRGAYW